MRLAIDSCAATASSAAYKYWYRTGIAEKTSSSFIDSGVYLEVLVHLEVQGQVEFGLTGTSDHGTV
jgi:hypothetical protein